MFEDDEEADFEFSEFENWFDNNIGFFRRNDEEPLPEPTLKTELFYHSVYRPIMQELNKTTRTLMVQHYPHIATEHRPEVLEEIDWRVGRTGHKFLLFLYAVVQDQQEEIDLRLRYPKLDEWAISYPSYRKPLYAADTFFDQFPWLTEEEKQELLEEDRKRADEIFAFKEKPRFEFFDMVQRSITRHFKGIGDLDSDGWTMYNVLLSEEYMDYRIRFEYIDGFIKYEFNVEDLKLPYEEYSKRLSEKWKIQWEQEQKEKEDSNKVSPT
jgi:hypothetical protein